MRHLGIGCMKVYPLGSKMNSVKWTNLGLYRTYEQEYKISMQDIGNVIKNVRVNNDKILRNNLLHLLPQIRQLLRELQPVRTTVRNKNHSSQKTNQVLRM